MTIRSSEISPNSKRPASARRAVGDEAASSPDRKSRAPARKTLKPAEKSSQKRVTKHAQLLMLLSQPPGAGIEDMMQATGWQQHSVRGFLAGTVKKKLDLELTSAKTTGEVRRYRIVTRRGR